MTEDIRIDIEPIGYVDNPDFAPGAASGEKRKDAGWKAIDASIILKDEYADGLDDIEKHKRLILQTAEIEHHEFPPLLVKGIS
jgi:tRNA (Thr-GGU) A37 N-methylase